MGRLDELHPKVKELALKLKEECKKVGIELCIYCTYRSIAEQNALYAQGRTKPGEVVTNAKGGQSMHNFRVAFDCGPVINGDVAWKREDLFRKIGAIGKKLGLEWGGDFTKIKNGKRVPFPDLPHFQLTQGLTYQDFQAGKMIK